MLTPLKRHKEDSKTSTNQAMPKFQEFKNSHHQLDELIFLSRIALLGSLTVIFSFALLCLGLAPIWAFLFAFGLSTIGIIAIAKLIQLLK